MAAGVKEINPNQSVTDTQIPYREHDKISHAKRVVSVMPLPPADPDDKTRSLKPTTVVLGAGGTGGFDLKPDETYLFIGQGHTNIALAASAGIVTPDSGDLFVPAYTPTHIHTGSLWTRLEMYSAAGSNTQLVRVG